MKTQDPTSKLRQQHHLKAQKYARTKGEEWARIWRKEGVGTRPDLLDPDGLALLGLVDNASMPFTDDLRGWERREILDAFFRGVEAGLALQNGALTETGNRWCATCDREHGRSFVCSSYSDEIRTAIEADQDRDLLPFGTPGDGRAEILGAFQNRRPLPFSRRAS